MVRLNVGTRRRVYGEDDISIGPDRETQIESFDTYDGPEYNLVFREEGSGRNAWTELEYVETKI